MISIIVWFTVQLTHCTSQQDTLKCVSIFWLYTCFFLHNHNFCQQWFISLILKILRFLSDCLSLVFLCFVLKPAFLLYVQSVSFINASSHKKHSLVLTKTRRHIQISLNSTNWNKLVFFPLCHDLFPLLAIQN